MNDKLLEVCEKISPVVLAKLSMCFHVIDEYSDSMPFSWPGEIKIDDLWLVITEVILDIEQKNKKEALTCFTTNSDLKDCPGTGHSLCKECSRLI